jgi:NAD+ synthase
MKIDPKCIINWIVDYANRAEKKSLVVGVFGDLDSALVSTLCSKTKIDTHCCILPCQSDLEHVKLANDHIKWLCKQNKNVFLHEIDLTNTFENLSEIFKNSNISDKLGEVNSKNRLRMIILYQIATAYSGLVVGSGNKVKNFGVGFFTKYGDNGVDISPIGDMLKSEIKEMSKFLKISSNLINSTPSDGLWLDGRTDEEQLGATYEELEWAMLYRHQYNKQLLCDFVEDENITFMSPERQFEVLKIYDTLYYTSLHKMRPIPVFKLERYKICQALR